MQDAFEGGGGGGRRLHPAVVVVLLVAVVAAGARLAAGGVEPELAVEEDATAAPSEGAPPAAVAPQGPQVLPGDWVAVADAPVPPRTRHTATWTGSEVLIYGGQPDPGDAAGIRFDPTSGAWTPMAPSPLGSRVGHTATWTGTTADGTPRGSGELIVVEGAPVGQDAAIAAQSLDAAAYDPGTDTWRVLPPAPINPRAGHVAVWTGRELVVYGGARTFEGYVPAAAYDPAADAWRLTSPSPLARAHGLAAAVWTGEEVVIWTGTGEEDVAAYDPDADTWRLLPGSPIGMRSAAPVWTGSEVLILGQPSVDRTEAGGLALDLATGRWSVLPPSPQVFAATVSVVWTGESAVVVGGPSDDVGAAWTPSRSQWQQLPLSPQPAISGHAAVWTGEGLLVWGGFGDGLPLNTGALFAPS